VGPEADEEVDLATSDELVEEVPIDSMCGVK
jgi:mycofactocin precursor